MDPLSRLLEVHLVHLVDSLSRLLQVHLVDLVVPLMSRLLLVHLCQPHEIEQWLLGGALAVVHVREVNLEMGLWDGIF